MKEKGKWNLLIVSTSLILATIIFYIWFGWSPLNVTDDYYLRIGYAESDNIQHYAGWLAFRDSEWTWPIGNIQTLSYPEGTQITFMDSIPILAIIFKLFDSLLPDTFQYFGIYVFMCIVLQIFFSQKILLLYNSDRKRYGLVLLESFCLGCSPIMIERAFRHTSLASHWIVLWSIYLYLSIKKDNKNRRIYAFWLLSAFSILIHPYFLPQVFGILFATVLEQIVKEKNWRNTIILLGGEFVIIFGLSYMLGIVGQGMDLQQGYGLFSMNINALWNPISTNIMSTGSSSRMYLWSSFIPEQSQGIGNYDGFNYLGVGVLIGILVVLFHAGMHANRSNIKRIIKEYWAYVLALFIFSVYAISNSIDIYGYQINVPIPTWLYNICSIFAASGRIFWPVYYSIVLFVFGYINKYICTSLRGTYLLVATIVFLQIYDLKNIIYVKHSYFENLNGDETNAPYDYEYDEEIWKYIEENYDYVWIQDYYRSVGYGLAQNCAKRHLTTNYITSNRNSEKQLEEAQKFVDYKFDELLKGNIDYNAVYLVTDEEMLSEIEAAVGERVEYNYEYGDREDHYSYFYIVLPKVN